MSRSHWWTARVLEQAGASLRANVAGGGVPFASAVAGPTGVAAAAGAVLTAVDAFFAERSHAVALLAEPRGALHIVVTPSASKPFTYTDAEIRLKKCLRADTPVAQIVKSMVGAEHVDDLQLDRDTLLRLKDEEKAMFRELVLALRHKFRKPEGLDRLGPEERAMAVTWVTDAMRLREFTIDGEPFLRWLGYGEFFRIHRKTTWDGGWKEVLKGLRAVMPAVTARGTTLTMVPPGGILKWLTPRGLANLINVARSQTIVAEVLQTLRQIAQGDLPLTDKRTVDQIAACHFTEFFPGLGPTRNEIVTTGLTPAILVQAVYGMQEKGAEFLRRWGTKALELSVASLKHRDATREDPCDGARRRAAIEDLHAKARAEIRKKTRARYRRAEAREAAHAMWKLHGKRGTASLIAAELVRLGLLNQRYAGDYRAALVDREGEPLRSLLLSGLLANGGEPLRRVLEELQIVPAEAWRPRFDESPSDQGGAVLSLADYRRARVSGL